MYTYAFLPHIAQPLDLPTGIAGPLDLVSVKALSAVVEPSLSVEALQSSDERLMQAVLAHDLVIRDLFQQTVVLPLRFGTCFVSGEKLIEHLESHHDDYLRRLNSLIDKAEYTLKLIPLEFSDSEGSTETTGRAYFLAKKQRYQAQADWQQQQQAELTRLLEMLAHNEFTFVRSDPKDGIERIYLLGDRHSDQALLSQVKIWQLQCPRWEIGLGESLPPYHFV